MRSAEIARLLPEVYQTALEPPPESHTAGSIAPDRLLAGALAAMEALHAPVEAVLDGLDRYADPRRAPDAFVPYLAGWVDLQWLVTPAPGDATAVPLATGLGRLRELVAGAAWRARWRGTRIGLTWFLETATGVSGFRIEENVATRRRLPCPFHLLILAPEAARPWRPLLERVISAEKPAHVTYELRFEDPASGPGDQEGRSET